MFFFTIIKLCSTTEQMPALVLITKLGTKIQAKDGLTIAIKFLDV
jgi:hypothetical protein